jgi:hypothetical protein
MKRKIVWLLLALSAVSTVVKAAEPAWWTQMKQDCLSSGGRPSSQFYNNWVQMNGCICDPNPSATMGSGKPRCDNRAGSNSPSATSTLQQQQMAIAQRAGELMGQALRDALFGNPEQQQAQQQAEEQRFEQARDRQRTRDAREADETRTRILAEVRGVERLPELQPRPTGGLPITPFPRGSAAADSGLPFKFGDGVQIEGGRSALEQLERAAGHGAAARAAGSSEDAAHASSQSFDTPGAVVALPRLAVATPTSRAAEPPTSDNPLVAELSRKLEENRLKRERLESDIRELKNDPRPSPEKQVQIAKKKDELQGAEQEKTYLDFSIKDETDRAKAATPAGSPASARAE